MCNGVDNCGDGSDENNHTLCANRPKICPNIFTDFKCANHNCVKRDKICNREDDCGDNSDERGCHAEGTCDDAEAEGGRRGGCQHRCNNLPGGGYLCLCDRGYLVDESNPKKCVDFNECTSFGHNCTHSCTNLNGTYSCSCAEGFELTDLFSGVCKVGRTVNVFLFHFCISWFPLVLPQVSEYDVPPSLLFSTGADIRGEHLANRTFYDVIKNEARIEAIDFNPRDMVVYWVDSREQMIKRSFLPDTSMHPEARIGHPQVVVGPNGRERTSLSFDWVTENLYWTEVNGNQQGKVVVATGDGRYRRTVVEGNLEYPTAVAVDPELGVMYFADAGSYPKIESAWLDGSKRQTVVDDRIQRPQALAVDFQMTPRTIYWADSKMNTIESMLANGKRRHVILQVRKYAEVEVFSLIKILRFSNCDFT